MGVEIIAPDGFHIKTLCDWRKHAPPQNPQEHWKPGRSAMELAYAWTRSNPPAVPAELDAVLSCNRATAGLVVQEAYPEAKTRLDSLRGGLRNSDLLLLAEGNGERAVIEIEAKVDEPFGEYVTQYWAKTQGRSSSGVPHRLKRIGSMIFGSSYDPSTSRIRYQLLHSTAAALIEAQNRKAPLAFFIIHEFVTPLCDQAKARRNHEDLREFVSRLSGSPQNPIRPGLLMGPFIVPGGQCQWGVIHLYVGWIQTVYSTVGRSPKSGP